MSIFVSGNTALACLRLNAGMQVLKPSRVTRLPASSGGIGVPTVAFLEEALGGGRLEVLVPGDRDRCNTDRVHCRIWSGPIPPGAFLSLCEGVYVSSPEFLFLQLASKLSLPRLVQVGDELCGTYSLSPRDRAYRSIPRAQSSRQAILDFIGHAPHSFGVEMARRAGCLLVDGSASPMETDLEIRASFPRRYGGFGAETPIMNKPIDLPPDAAAIAGRRQIRPDLLFPGYGVAMEYDSDQEHTGSDRITRDAKRRNVFRYLGLDVIVVTRQQIFDMPAFEDVMRNLFRLAGKPFRTPSPDQRRKRADLDRELRQRFFTQ